MIRKKPFRKIKPKDEVIQQWVQKGKPIPPPHIIKQKLIEEYQKKFNVEILIETGTYLGEMVEAQRNNFKMIYTIELSERLYLKAVNRFKSYSNIKILHGDSGTVLQSLISVLKEPALFWLDGHYSGGITALGSKECPVMEELIAICKSDVQHFILIDDARLFNGTHDYPTVEGIQSLLNSYHKKYFIEIKDDILRIMPK